MGNCVGHCHSPIDLTKSRSGGCILAASPRHASSRVVAAHERFWALRRYEQIIDRVDERCQIDGRAR